MLSINPAYAGCHDALSATLSYRNQWVGFNDAPEDICISVHTPVNNDRVGTGLLLGRTTYGIYSITSFSGNYAYRMEMFNGKLALGLAFGATAFNTDWNKLALTDPADMLLTGNDGFAVLPEFSLGAYYYTKRYFAGLSIPGFLSHDLNTSTGKYRMENDPSEYTFYVSGGYTFDICKDLKIMPSTLFRLRSGYKPQADFDAHLNIRDHFWCGAGYRSSNVLSGFLQCQLNYQLRMSYSYDLDLGRTGNYSNGSHEVLFCYVFRYLRKVTGPRNF